MSSSVKTEKTSPSPQKLEIPVLSRASNLARSQVREVLGLIREHHPHVQFDLQCQETRGDKDKQSSLRAMEKSDFFTREIDEALLQGQGRIGIHSAKDLPEPLREGLELFAITRSADRTDVLVLRPGQTLTTLRPGALIGCSSERRDAAVRAICPQVGFTEVRGTIEERLRALEKGRVDGLVMAKCALDRLGFSQLNMFTLPGETAPLQGQLAIVGRAGDEEMRALFSCLDVRK